MKISQVIFFLLICVSCDPMKNLTIKRDVDAPAKLVIYANAGIHSQVVHQQNLPTIIALEKEEPQKSIFFGMGSWDKEGIQQLSKKIDSIGLYSNSETIILKEQPQIQSYLKRHSKGIFKNSIILKSKE